MRVGLVLEQFDPPCGGLEQWTVRFADRLAQRGHEVHVVAGRFGQQTRSMPIVPHLLPRARSRRAFAAAARAKLLSLPLDVIHDMGAGCCCDVFQPHSGSRVALWERKLAMAPQWLRPLKRAVDPLLPRQRDFRRLLAEQYADNGQILVALSQSVARDFQHYHRVPAERIRVVYNGVDTDCFSPAHRQRYRRAVRRQLGIEQQTILALVVAHNFRLKGVPTVLRATARLVQQRLPVHLAVVGGQRLGGYVRAAGRLGLKQAVTFVGSVDDVAPYYAAADICLHPTFYDCCSLVVLEALAGGLPVVTSRFNGAGELMTEGLEGYVLDDPADVDELTDRFTRLLDPALREQMGAAARRLALRHTLAHNVDQILKIYEEAAARRTLSFRVRAPQCERRGGRREKGDRHHLPERPGGCFAQMVPVTFFPAAQGGLLP